MFDVGFPELVLIFIIGLLVLGPQRLPKVAAEIGKWVGRARRTATELRRQLEREIELNDLQSPPTQTPPQGSTTPPAAPTGSPAAETTPGHDTGAPVAPVAEAPAASPTIAPPGDAPSAPLAPAPAPEAPKAPEPTDRLPHA
ncbi:MAG TPA: Sec-independent protein translocase protein TatB [Gammaproteobacteria bacterium]|nr:Sec-independent protein translocase protein TatB [Gammaproteobacteria bacterium]